MTPNSGLLSHLWMNTAMSITLPMSLHAVDKAWSIAPRMQIWLSSNRWMHPASRIKTPICASASRPHRTGSAAELVAEVDRLAADLDAGTAEAIREPRT